MPAKAGDTVIAMVNAVTSKRLAAPSAAGIDSRPLARGRLFFRGCCRSLSRSQRSLPDIGRRSGQTEGDECQKGCYALAEIPELNAVSKGTKMRKFLTHWCMRRARAQTRQVARACTNSCSILMPLATTALRTASEVPTKIAASAACWWEWVDRPRYRLRKRNEGLLLAGLLQAWPFP